jgi:hypothetical protein
MGGIIVTNAVGRAELTGLVDGAVSVCGAYNSHAEVDSDAESFCMRIEWIVCLWLPLLSACLPVCLTVCLPDCLSVSL